MQRFLTPIVLASLILGQGYPAMYAQQPSPVVPAQNQAPAATAPADFLLTDGTDVQLVFDDDLSSKTSQEGDQITLVLSEDLKVGDILVAKAGAKAQGEITNAKKAGMMGKAGELNIRLNYLKVGALKVHLRGTKGKEGESGTTGAIVLTVLFGPIGLIKHGKDITIKKGSALHAYVSDDIKVPPVS